MPNLLEFEINRVGKPKFTGKSLVILNSSATSKSITTHANNVSLKLASYKDYKNDAHDFNKAFDEADGIVFEQLGVAVVNGKRDQQVSILTESSRTKNTFIFSEPERYVYAISDSFAEYMRGYKSAVDDIYNKIASGPQSKNKHNIFYDDDHTATWGIHATGVLNSKYKGKGVNIAVLDTGFNLKHLDFMERTIKSKSFIKRQKVDDRNGHGSHCIGIAAGDINKRTGTRHGVAGMSNIFVGKVLSNEGEGTDSSILAGIEWALANQCKVISMSLGASVDPGESYSQTYNQVAARAAKLGAIIIAAAGNDSDREAGIIKPVNHPANCPSIMAVAALDKKSNIAYYSCGAVNLDGGQVDIIAPGSDIYSSWKGPDNYNTISGTSMATPFVAGIAALLWEKNPNASAADIWMYLVQNARRLNYNSSDVGSGLVQAP